MLSIPIDVLRLILEHVNKADLLAICLVNKICCSCSQDVLYRNIQAHRPHQCTRICQSLAQSTNLARRVRSFDIACDEPELRGALQNMTLLRSLSFPGLSDFSILDGCAFKLVSFQCCVLEFQPLHRFLDSQPSLTYITLADLSHCIPNFSATCLPNLTRVTSDFSWLPQLIPNRPVSDVTSYGYTDGEENVDFSFFTLSTVPIQKLTIDLCHLYPKSGQLLASIFPSLTYIKITSYGPFQLMQLVRKPSSIFI
jgi:F-box domain